MFRLTIYLITFLISMHFPPFSFSKQDSQAYFTDVAIESGLYDIDSVWGTSWVDYNKDGFVDLFIPNHMHRPSYLFANNGDGTFSRTDKKLGLSAGLDDHAGTFADYNNDGFKDVYTASGVHHKDHFYQNIGGDYFVEVSEFVNLDFGHLGRGRVGLWFDADNDSLLDLYLVNSGTENFLYRNNGGHFEEVGQKIGLNFYLPQHHAYVADLDNDFDMDILNVQTISMNCINFSENVGGFNFIEKKKIYAKPVVSCVDAAIGDYDNDGDLDILLTVLDDKSILLNNNGFGFFSDVTKKAKIAFEAHRLLHSSWADINNDGWLDLILLRGGYDFAEDQTNILYINNKDGTFSDQSASSGFDEKTIGNTAAGSWADYDNDGDLDLFVPNGHGARIAYGKYQLFRNNSGNQNNWIKVNLVGTKSNRDAYGARVYVYTKDGMQMREHIPFNGLAQNQSQIHFGLDNLKVVDRLEVVWPSGNVQWVHHFKPNQVLTIIEQDQSNFFYTPPSLVFDDFHMRHMSVLTEQLIKELEIDSKNNDYEFTSDFFSNAVVYKLLKDKYQKTSISSKEMKQHFDSKKIFTKSYKMFWIEDFVLGSVTARKKPTRRLNKEKDIILKAFHEGKKRIELLDSINGRKWDLFDVTVKKEKKYTPSSLKEGFFTFDMIVREQKPHIAYKIMNAKPQDILGPFRFKEHNNMHPIENTFPVKHIVRRGPEKMISASNTRKTNSLIVKNYLRLEKSKNLLEELINVEKLSVKNFLESSRLFFLDDLFKKDAVKNFKNLVKGYDSKVSIISLAKLINSLLEAELQKRFELIDLEKVPGRSLPKFYELSNMHIGKKDLADQIESDLISLGNFDKVAEINGVTHIRDSSSRQTPINRKFIVTTKYSEERFFNRHGKRRLDKLFSLKADGKSYSRINSFNQNDFYQLNQIIPEQPIDRSILEKVYERKRKIELTRKYFNELLQLIN